MDSFNYAMDYDDFMKSYKNSKSYKCEKQLNTLLTVVFQSVVEQIKDLGFKGSNKIKSLIYQELAHFENRTGLKSLDCPAELTSMDSRDVCKFITEIVGIFDKLNKICNPVEISSESIVKRDTK